MHPILKNILAVVAGFLLGSFVNMAIISLSGSLIPPPSGINPEDLESLKENIHLFEPKHFLMPFLAHALGTLAGAFVAAYLATSQKMIFALIIGATFLAGGIAMISIVPSPTWFTIVDLGLAYIPPAFAGWAIAQKIQMKP